MSHFARPSAPPVNGQPPLSQPVWSLLIELDQQLHEVPPAEAMPDERLKLIFTCCHPALSIEACVALTLRTLGGLTTTESPKLF